LGESISRLLFLLEQICWIRGSGIACRGIYVEPRLSTTA
jgi:hypothetical protein